MLKVLDLNGDSQEVEVMRYFQLNDASYLIYSLGEVDEQDHVKLYGVKVGDGSGQVIQDDEWVAVRDEIKRIIPESKAGNSIENDLDFKLIDGITINDFRAFKLSNEHVGFLKANKKEFVSEEVTETELPETEPVEEESNEVQEESNEVQEQVVAEETEEAPTFDFQAEQPVEETPVETTEEDATFDVQAEQPADQPIEEKPVEEAPAFEFPGQEETPGNFDLGLEEQPAEEVQAEMPTAEDVNEIKPEAVASFDGEETQDFKTMYNDANELVEVLKSENDELKKRLNKIAQMISE